MASKKGGLLDYGKSDEPKGGVEIEVEDEGDDEEGDSSSPAEMRIRHLAEQTGVDDPDALIKLVRACMKAG